MASQTPQRTNSVHSSSSTESSEEKFFDAKEKMDFSEEKSSDQLKDSSAPSSASQQTARASIHDNDISSERRPVSPLGKYDFSDLPEGYAVSPIEEEPHDHWPVRQHNPNEASVAFRTQTPQTHNSADSDPNSTPTRQEICQTSHHQARRHETFTYPTQAPASRKAIPLKPASQLLETASTDSVSPLQNALHSPHPGMGFQASDATDRTPIRDVEEEGGTFNETASGIKSRWTNTWHGPRATALKDRILSHGSSMCRSIATGWSTGVKWLDRRSSGPRSFLSVVPGTRQSGQPDWKTKISSVCSDALKSVFALARRGKESRRGDDMILPTRNSKEAESTFNHCANHPVF